MPSSWGVSNVGCRFDYAVSYRLRQVLEDAVESLDITVSPSERNSNRQSCQNRVCLSALSTVFPYTGSLLETQEIRWFLSMAPGQTTIPGT